MLYMKFRKTDIETVRKVAARIAAFLCLGRMEHGNEVTPQTYTVEWYCADLDQGDPNIGPESIMVGSGNNYHLYPHNEVYGWWRFSSRYEGPEFDQQIMRLICKDSDLELVEG